MNIVVVDDDLVYLNLLSEILSLYGHTVFKAPDGDTALAFLRDEQVDMAISDVSMPNMNGMTLHTRVREDRRYKRLPFIWNSAYGELRELLEITDPSIDFKVDKAGELSTLLHLVARVETSQRIVAARGTQGT